MSRIGRDHLQVGFFTDILFREKEVRFIAINNGIDSDRQETSEFAPFLNIMNEWFVRDTSKKIKAVLKSRGSSGNAHTSNIPPYGYLKDPENPDHWIIDEEAAEVVRRIYRMTIEGKGPYQIARELSEEKIERPSYYLGKKGLGNHASNYDKENPYMWRGNQVTTLIARPEYIGKTVNFRTFKNSYKDKKVKRANKEDWVVFDDTQEPIVDEETWLLAQKLRQNVRKADPMGEPNVLTGKIYCADCGAPMYNHRERKGRERIYYTAKGEKRTSYSNPADCYECSTYNLGRQKYDRHCTCHHISTKALKSIILKTIQETCHYVSLNEQEFVYSLQEESAMKDIAVSETVKKRIERNQKRLHELDMYYVVDLDIKGFFDNINHRKLLRQIWALGIRDKKLICIIKEMLKAPVILPDGKRIYPEKGTPQGGILSPLLANIVLNELDWWIASQWEQMPTKTKFKTRENTQGTEIKSHAYRALRRSNLKEVHAVRYADDFKIFCTSHADAVKAYKATELWLKDRLGLDISPEKSKVVNLKRQYSEFLGFKLKVRKKGKKYVVRSHMSDKAYRKAHAKITEEVAKLEHSSDDAQFIQLQKYNSVVAGLHEYYCIATEVSHDFGRLAFAVNKKMRNRLKGDLSKKGQLRNGFIREKYGASKQLRFLHGRPIVPLGYVQSKNAQHKRKAVNKYTAEGRKQIHQNLKLNTSIMLWMMRNPVKSRTVEYADNRISLFAAQYGKCAITGMQLSTDDIHCHHKVPVSKGGGDEYANLILVSKDIHTVIHASTDETIRKYLTILKLDAKQLTKLNKLRTMAEMPQIIL